jgi:hypothetical protein
MCCVSSIQIMKKEFGMVAPDIEIADQGVILVSSEEGETEGKAS